MEKQGRSKIDAFKLELGKLLRKYDASIDVAYGWCSDMHGVEQEGIEVSFGRRSNIESTFKLTRFDWCIEAGDLITNKGELI